MDRDSHVLYGSLDGHYVTMTRGDGVYVYDGDGNRYLDAVGGVCVVNIGHGVQEVIDAINEQAAVLTYTYGGIVDNEPRQRLAQKLQQWAPPGMGHTRTLFCSGGAEANEGGPEARLPVPPGAGESHQAEGHRQVAELPRQHRRHAFHERPHSVEVPEQPAPDRPASHSSAVLLPLPVGPHLPELRADLRQRAAARRQTGGRREHRGLHRGADNRYLDVGRRAARRVLRGHPRHLRRERHPVHLRRGDERRWPHGEELGNRALGSHTRHHHVVEGSRGRLLSPGRAYPGREGVDGHRRRLRERLP